MRLVSHWCICVLVPSNIWQSERASESKEERPPCDPPTHEKNHRFPPPHPQHPTADLCLFVNSNGTKNERMLLLTRLIPRRRTFHRLLFSAVAPLSLLRSGAAALTGDGCFLTARAAPHLRPPSPGPGKIRQDQISHFGLRNSTIRLQARRRILNTSHVPPKLTHLIIRDSLALPLPLCYIRVLAQKNNSEEGLLRVASLLKTRL